MSHASLLAGIARKAIRIREKTNGDRESAESVATNKTDNGGYDKDGWNTPHEVASCLYELADGRIGLDPCHNTTSILECNYTYDIREGQDGLNLPWGGKGLVFVNPPYSRGLLQDFAIKIETEAGLGTEIVALVPANVETAVWQEIFWEASAVCFPDHRIKYLIDGKPRGVGLMGSGLPYFGTRPYSFANAFSKLGRIVTL